MSDFIFSVNSVIPVFMVIALGFYLRRKGILNDEVTERMNGIVFSFALPLMLFRDVARSDFNAIFDMKLVLWAIITTLISFALNWLFAEIFMENKSDIGAYVQGAFRSNYAIIGLTMAANVLGDANTGKAAIVITFVIPIYNVLSVAVLSARNSEKKTDTSLIKRTAVNLYKNPLIIGILLALPFSIFKIKIPGFAMSGIQYMASLATPLALLSIGGGIDFKESAKNMKWAVIASINKLILTPLIFLPLSVLFLEARGETLMVLFVLYASPTAISSYIMARRMKSGHRLAANIILITTLSSVFTYTVGIYILKSFDLI